MKLTQLYYFQTACRLESISRAAERLHISQPSISTAIQALEEEFGYPLLARQGKRFALTAEGSVFLRETDRLLSHARSFEQFMSSLTEQTQPIALGVPPMIGSLILPRILSPEGEFFAPFQLHIMEAGRQELVRPLGSNEVDMAFLPHDRPVESQYRTVPVMGVETVCCVSAAHPLAGYKEVTPRDLREMPLVMFKESFFQTEHIMDLFRAAEVEPKILLQTSQLSTVQRLIARNMAAGFLFQELVNPLPNVVSIPLVPPMKIRVSLVWRSNDVLPQEHLRFIEHIRALFPQPVEM